MAYPRPYVNATAISELRRELVHEAEDEDDQQRQDVGAVDAPRVCRLSRPLGQLQPARFGIVKFGAGLREPFGELCRPCAVFGVYRRIGKRRLDICDFRLQRRNPVGQRVVFAPLLV